MAEALKQSCNSDSISLLALISSDYTRKCLNKNCNWRAVTFKTVPGLSTTSNITLRMANYRSNIIFAAVARLLSLRREIFSPLLAAVSWCDLDLWCSSDHLGERVRNGSDSKSCLGTIKVIEWEFWFDEPRAHTQKYRVELACCGLWENFGAFHWDLSWISMWQLWWWWLDWLLCCWCVHDDATMFNVNLSIKKQSLKIADHELL